MQTNLTAAMSLIEPAILIVMGLVVTTILISFMVLPDLQSERGWGERPVRERLLLLLRIDLCG